MKVSNPEGPHTELKCGSLGYPGWYSFPSSLHCSGWHYSLSLLKPWSHHKWAEAPGFKYHAAQVNLCRGQKSWGELQTGRQTSDQQARISLFKGDHEDTAAPHLSYYDQDMAYDSVWPHGEDPMRTASGSGPTRCAMWTRTLEVSVLFYSSCKSQVPKER